MSDQVTFAHVLQFTTNVQHKLQQKGSRFENAVMIGSHTGMGAVPVEQVGAVVAEEFSTRHDDSPMISVPHARRWVYPRNFRWGDMIDREDAVRMLIDPKSPYLEAGTNAIRRAMDDRVIEAFNATSVVGSSAGGGGTTTEAFNTTDYQIVHGSVGMTISKLRTALQKFIGAEVDTDSEQMYVCVGAQQVSNLLNETQMISIDYNTNRVLVDGKLQPFMGFNFIISNRLPKASTTRSCFAWAKSGMHLGKWGGIEANAAIRPDKNFNWYAHVRGIFGATRLEQGKVIEIQATEV